MQFTGDLPTAAESWTYVMVRWATFTSLVLLIGACVFLMVLQRALDRPECRALGDLVRTRVRATGLAASLAVLALAPARVLLQQRVLSDALGDGTRITLGDLLGGDWGVGVALQLVAGGVGAVAFARTLGGMRQ